MAEPSKAVFLSYASQDVAAAKRIVDALRTAGVEVWFDQNELAGGDAWDQKIRAQIKACALFIPVISAASQARREGYFRIEWKIAAQRTHAFADGTPFLFPLVIDQTTDAEALVPEEFRAVQWTRLPDGETPPAFALRIARLLAGETPPLSSRATAFNSPHARNADDRPPARGKKRVSLAIVVSVSAAIAGLAAITMWYSRDRASTAPVREVSVANATTAALPKAVSISEARQLARRARGMTTEKYNSTAADYVAAEGLFRTALKLDENDAEIWALSSEFNTAIRTRGFDDSQERRELARSQAERALKLDPDSIAARYALGRWQRDNDPDYHVAEKTLLEVLKRDPNHSGSLFTLGTLYTRVNRFDDALAVYQRVAREPKSAALALYGEYLLYFSRARFADAERCLHESIAIEPSANSVTGLAMVLLTSKGDVAGATRALSDVPTASRTEHRAVWMTAFVHLVAREPEAVLSALRLLPATLIQDNWFVGPTDYWTGRAHAQAGRPAAARIAYESGLSVVDTRLKQMPGNAALHVARGELLAFLGRDDEALREARTASESAKADEHEVWFVSPVRIYAALGRSDDAMPLLETLCARARSGESTFWPLTPELLRLDPLWDKLRDDPRFVQLSQAHNE